MNSASILPAKISIHRDTHMASFLSL